MGRGKGVAVNFEYSRLPNLAEVRIPSPGAHRNPKNSDLPEATESVQLTAPFLSGPLKAPTLSQVVNPDAPPQSLPTSIPKSEPTSQAQRGLEDSSMSWSGSGLTFISTLEGKPESTSPTTAPRGELADWLDARARPVFSAQTLDGVVQEVVPLLELVSQAPDPKSWNESTWNAFQLASSLSPQELTQAARSIEQADPCAPSSMPLGLKLSLSDPHVNRDTLVRMMRLRAFASQIVEAELPSLLPSERKNYLQLVHDQGYANAQLARTCDPSSLLCGVQGPQLLDKQRLDLLSPGVAQKFGDKARSQAQSLEEAMPKLTLKDFFSEAPTDAQSQQKAETFLKLSGKDIDVSAPELGGKSMKQFLQRMPSENRSQWLSRLAGKQIFNSLGRNWQDLQADISSLEKQGAPGELLRNSLEGKQQPALAPALLVLNAPSIFQPAAEGATTQLAQSLDAMMQVFWRVTSPQLPFSDPLISKGQDQLRDTHQEQLSKDRALWMGVVHLKKTAILAGITDAKYSQRTSSLPTGSVFDSGSDDVNLALSRLERDLGPGSPAYQKIQAEVTSHPGDAQAVNRLHALRFDPDTFSVPVPKGQTTFQFGPNRFSFQPQDGQFRPEIVSATTVAYKVDAQIGDQHQSGLLRLPKGARPQFDDQGHLKLEIFDAERFNEVSARLQDFAVMDKRVDMTTKSIFHSGTNCAVLEHRKTMLDAGQSLKEGARLSSRDVNGLMDQWLSGLAESDPDSRPFGVFYELGPDNYVMGDKGIQGSYVDVALAFRNERERSTFGFVAGGYGSAVNWIVADNQPLDEARTQEIWQGVGLQPDEESRRQLFIQALQERQKPDHPVWGSLPADKRDAVYQSFLADLEAIGLK